MRAKGLLWKLYCQRVEISRRDNNLHLRAPKGCITGEIEGELKELKARILDLLEPTPSEEGWTMVAQWRFISLPEGTLGARLDTPGWKFWPRTSRDGSEEEVRGQ